MSSLTWLIRDYIETRAGRITWSPIVRLFLPASTRRQPVRNFRILRDADDREYGFFRGRGAHCSQPTLWMGRYPRTEVNGTIYFIVPASDCKVCQYHEQGYGRRKASYCLWDRQRFSSDPSPREILANAVKEAKEIISGPDTESVICAPNENFSPVESTSSEACANCPGTTTRGENA